MKRYKRVFNFAWKILLIVFILLFIIKESFGTGDFKVFLEAAKLIVEGDNPYHKWIMVSEGNYCKYFYSPLWAIILVPFSYLPNTITNIVWLLLNLFFLYKIWILIWRKLNRVECSQKQINIILVFSLLLSIRFILYNFGMIQMTIFLLWGILESIQLMQKKNILYGSILLALIINIKIIPIAILPYLLYRSYYKAFGVTVIGVFVSLIVPAIFVGWERNMFLFIEWMKVINPQNVEHVIESELGPHSLTALIPILLSETEGVLELRRNFASLNFEQIKLVTNIFQLSLITFIVFFLKLPPFRKPHSETSELWELSAVLLLLPLIFPHQQKYAFLFLLPAQIYLSVFIVCLFKFKKDVGKVWHVIVLFYVLSFIFMTLTTDGVIGRELNIITQHFKLITYGALFLFTSLVFANHKYLEKLSEK